MPEPAAGDVPQYGSKIMRLLETLRQVNTSDPTAKVPRRAAS